MINLKSLCIGKTDVVDTKEDRLQLIYAINLFIFIVVFPKCVMCYPRIYVKNQFWLHNKKRTCKLWLSFFFFFFLYTLKKFYSTRYKILLSGVVKREQPFYRSKINSTWLSNDFTQLTRKKYSTEEQILTQLLLSKLLLN